MKSFPGLRFSALIFSGILFPTVLLRGQINLSPAPSVGSAITSVGSNLARNLPMGGEFSKNLDGTVVGVRIVSRPFFGSDPKTWSMITVGSATLTFARDAQGGGMLLVGDSMQALPNVVVLGEDGRPARPLDIKMTVDRPAGLAKVSMGGKEGISVRVNLPSGATAVVVSAGLASTWTLDAVELIGVESLEGSGSADEKNNERDLPQTKVLPVFGTPEWTTEYNSSFDDGLALAHGKNIPAAERRLFALNENKPGTAEWFVESASKLVRLSLTLRERYDYPMSTEVAQRALELLEEGGRLGLSSKTPLQVSAFETAGFLKEEVLRDEEAAVVEYRKAAALDPKAPRAKEAIARLKADHAKDLRLSNAK